MYRLLIVDDEQVIRQKLSGFPREENDIPKGGDKNVKMCGRAHY